MHRVYVGIALLFTSFVTTSARAHDPGLSNATLTFEGERVTLNLRFARTDIETLVSIDTDHDGIVSDDEFRVAIPQLREVARTGFLIDGIELQPLEITREKNDGIAFTLSATVQSPDTKTMLFQLPLLEQLARGHRLFVMATDTVAPVNHTLLSADSAQAVLQVRDGALQPFSAFVAFLKHGVWHIWVGFDHSAFLLLLLLPAVALAVSLRTAIVQVAAVATAFTAAHSITLTLAALEITTLPSRPVEIAIAATVVLAGLANLHPAFARYGWRLAFGFGLIHGFGFASVVADLGLPRASTVTALVGFNLGVELGQLVLLAVALPVLHRLMQSSRSRNLVVPVGSLAIAALGGFWFVERLAQTNSGL